ncbi:hypothetical protein HYU07_05855 [Candidatus Woesearchaeota archaeon]|nr:hypothetical protein [Candidatus Woesearchaeota archaeon]
MKIDELSLNEVLLLAEEATDWEKLPTVHCSQSSINMANTVVLDHELTVKAYTCKSSGMQTKISYERRINYANSFFAVRKAVSHHKFGISIFSGTALVKEFTDSKIMRLYKLIERNYEK